MTTAFYAGSFDPFTNGHLQVVTKAAAIFDKVIIGIGKNPNKRRRINIKTMKAGIEAVLESRNIKNFEVIIFENLTVRCAQELKATHLIRGTRNITDYMAEESLASINESLSGIDTIFFRAGKLGDVSSSMVMELYKHGEDVSEYLAPEILEIIDQIDFN